MSVPFVPSRIIWWIDEGGQGVMAAVVVTFPGDLGSDPASELREVSMAGDWLQVEAPLGLEGAVSRCIVEALVSG